MEEARRNGRNGELHPTWRWVVGLAGAVIMGLAALFANAVLDRLDQNTEELKSLHATLGDMKSTLSALEARVEERGGVIRDNTQRIRELEREHRNNK